MTTGEEIFVSERTVVLSGVIHLHVHGMGQLGGSIVSYVKTKDLLVAGAVLIGCYYLYAVHVRFSYLSYCTTLKKSTET